MIDQRIFDININFHGVKGLVFIGKKILVYRRDNKTSNFPLCIDLPGGGKENNESPFDTFSREVKEEFGLVVDQNDIEYGKQYMSFIDPTKEAYFIVTKPLNIKESDIVFGDEGQEFFLMILSEYLKLSDAIGRQQEKVLDYLREIGERTNLKNQ
ncbi:MAG: NUDIX domain-containing protein [Candidatus Falkowbacteria bacterium]|nr:NUDIX domain-containing protein [Candidatus Falkowbacteria bacterium]